MAEEVNKALKFRCTGGVVTLDVIVGEGQTGSISVYRNGTKIKQGADKLEGFELGDCASLAGSQITVRSTVNVVHHQTGRTSLVTTVHGGADEDPDVIPGPEVGVGEQVRFKVVYTREEA